MTDQRIILVESLSKSFLIHQEGNEKYTALRDVVSKKARDIVGKQGRVKKKSLQEFWALRDVSFSVKQGDRIGIIGRNGAGKSTLLKILSRITEPTDGRVKIKGRVASLLEVGTGFHPELTGRENIFLNGAILGMSRREIRSKFDEIVAFAEVEQFLDTPVKRYSSGMYVRLAFAVAAHLEPEILIVDEVLAVGDAQFQKKCMGKMEDVSRADGRTIIFVSHNMSAIQNLCTSGIFLNKGSIEHSGNVHDVIDRYLTQGVAEVGTKWSGSHPENEYARILSVVATKTNASTLNEFYLDDQVKITTSVNIRKMIRGLAFELFVSNSEGTVIFSSFTSASDANPGDYRVDCTIPSHTFNNGKYFFSIGLSKDYRFFLIKLDDILSVEFHNTASGLGWQGDWPGLVRPKIAWTVKY